MTWKAIGKSVTGTSHIAVEKPCEDALHYSLSYDRNGNEILVCCASDGAGSALRASTASSHIAQRCVELLQEACINDNVSEATAFEIAEIIYHELKNLAEENNSDIEEYAATMLACAITKTKAVFLQIGDGGIVRRSRGSSYRLLWWPQSGEYHNTTHFLVDDENMPNLNVLVTEETIDEVALLTDGLQMLALSTENRTAHAPFFDGLFNTLRHAGDNEKINTLNNKLAEWLDSASINNRTDDDKTLFLATRLTP